MSQRHTTQQLLDIKAKLGPIAPMDFAADDLPSAHRMLGQEVRIKVHALLADKLSKIESPALADHIRLLRQCHRNASARMAAPNVPPRIRLALQEYLASFDAWLDGAGLTDFRHPRLEGLLVDGLPVTPADLGLWLQGDEGACQTGVYRQSDGSLLLWHTEENREIIIGERFDKLRVATLKFPDEDGEMQALGAFVYPEVLPGSTFGWNREGYVQAVDTLFAQWDTNKDEVLSHVPCWVAWRLGAETSPQEVVAALAPFWGAYTITAVQPRAGKVTATKVEFSCDEWIETSLGETPGSFLFQANTISDKDHPCAAYERLQGMALRKYEGRVTRTRAALANPRAARDPRRFLLGLLASRHGGGYAYANEDVKAYFLAHISPDGAEICIGAGPAVRGEALVTIRTSPPVE